MSDDPPETPTKAARALIGWFAGGLAFESVHAYAEQNSISAALGYGAGAIAVAIIDYKLKALLAGSPKLVRSLNGAASNAWLWIVVGIASLIVIALSPYIEQQRVPFATWFEPKTIEDIPKAPAGSVVSQSAINVYAPLPAQSPPVGVASPTVNTPAYRNEMGLTQSGRLLLDLMGIFKDDVPITFSVTAPDDNRKFQHDLVTFLRTACGLSKPGARCKYVDPPDSSVDLDAKIDEPKYPGITIHQDENSPSIRAGGSEYFSQNLRCFLTHHTTDIPKWLEKLKADPSDRAYWFEIGHGSPWVLNANQNVQCAPVQEYQRGSFPQ